MSKINEIFKALSEGKTVEDDNSYYQTNSANRIIVKDKKNEGYWYYPLMDLRLNGLDFDKFKVTKSKRNIELITYLSDHGHVFECRSDVKINKSNIEIGRRTIEVDDE